MPLAILLAVAILFALPMRAQTAPSDQVYLPIAGHAVSGATTWATDLNISNLSAIPADLALIFTPANIGTPTILRPTEHIHLAPYERKEMVDPLPSFGIVGIGMLIFDACFESADCGWFTDFQLAYAGTWRSRPAISVQARIYSYATAGGPMSGTRGESITATPFYALPRAPERVAVVGIRNDDRWHTNIGVINGSEFSATIIRIALFDGHNVAHGQYDMTLGPLANVQMAATAMFPALAVNRLSRTPPLSAPWVRVEQFSVTPTGVDLWGYGCEGGCPRFDAYASVTDGATGDFYIVGSQNEGPSGVSTTAQQRDEPVRVQSLHRRMEKE